MRENYTKNDAAKAVLFVLLMQIVVSLLFGMVEVNFAYEIFCYFVSEMIFVGVFLYINVKQKTNGFKKVNIAKKTDWLSALIALLIGVLTLFLCFHFFSYIDLLLEKIGFKQSSGGVVIDKAYKLLIALIPMALLPAFGEELIYRGVVLDGLCQKKKVVGVFLSAGLFAIMHLGVFQLFFQFFLGVIFGFVVCITHDIKLSMIMHFVNNALVLVFSYLGAAFNFNWFFGTKINFWLTLVMFAVCIALIIFLVNIIKKRYAKSSGENVSQFVFNGKTDTSSNGLLIIVATVYLVLGITNSLVS